MASQGKSPVNPDQVSPKADKKHPARGVLLCGLILASAAPVVRALAEPGRLQPTSHTVYVDSRIPTATCATYDPARRSCLGGHAVAYKAFAGAGQVAAAGTIVVIREGVYKEPLVPQTSGTADAPIVFRSADGEAVTLTGIDAPAIQVIGRQHLAFEGLTVNDVTGWGRVQDSESIVFRRMVFRNANATGTTGGLKFVRALHNQVRESQFEDGTDEILLQDGSNFNLIVQNTFHTAHHSLLSIRCSGENVIRGNRFDNPRQKGLEILDCEGVSDAPVRVDATKRNLIEGNVIAHTRESDRVYVYNAIQHGGQQTIVRRNVFEANSGGGVNYQEYDKESVFVYGNRLYHNTFYANRCFAIVGNQGDRKVYGDNRATNNLLYSNHDCAGGGGQTSIEDSGAVILGANAIESRDPGFRDAKNGDFRLAPGSAPIDRGSSLTVASAPGDGTSLPVRDVLWFYDGAGIAGERGDEIQLAGTTDRARIVRIDVAGHKLELDRPLSWRQGQGVALAFEGAAPDPGAFEGDGALPAIPALPAPPVVKSATASAAAATATPTGAATASPSVAASGVAAPPAAPTPARATPPRPGAWVPPIGIPMPPFGVTQRPRPVPVSWIQPTPGFYYVDAAQPSAVDAGNDLGTPKRPRKTIPTPLPAGSVVELHGIYDQSHSSPRTLVAQGTAANPVFIRGASVKARPTIRSGWELKGSYVILENLEFAPRDAQNTGTLVVLAPSSHAVLRNCELRGNARGGGLGIGSWTPTDSVDNVVVIGNLIHDNGDIHASFDQDVHGIAVGTRVSHLWVLDNQLYRNSGDGIQINGNRDEALTHHIYVGRNTAHDNKQTGFWTKQAVDVIFSENTCYGHRAGNSSYGQCMGAQYAPERAWFIFNHIYDCDFGIALSSDSDMGTGKNAFIIGNVIHNIHHHGADYNPATSWSNAAIMLAGSTAHVIANNTIQDVDAGINAPAAGSYYIVNNVIAGITERLGNHVFLELASAAEHAVMHHNLFGGTVKIRWASDRVMDLRQFSLPARGALGNLAAEPQFAAPEREDFHLRPDSPGFKAGSPDVETILKMYETLYGVSISGNVTTPGAYLVGATP